MGARMSVYTYRARDQKGVLSEGTINADSPAEASKMLRSVGKYVLDLTRGVQ
jgi:type II secretory pathway component PulF